MNNKKFIITKDELVADKMIASQFRLISANSGVYIFINKAPERSLFDEFDVKKLHFTNTLHL